MPPRPLSALAALLLAATGRAQDPPVWRFLDYGQRIGEAGLEVAAGAAGPEIVLSAFANRYWLVLAPQPGGGFRQEWSSPVVDSSAALRSLTLADVLPDPGVEVLLTTTDGFVEVWNLQARAQRLRFAVGAPDPRALAAGDLDGDGQPELAVVTASALRLFRLDGSLRATLPGPGGTDVAIADLDGDPALEVATTSGHVVDGATLAVEWQWAPGFGIELQAADVDSDGRAELIAGEYQQYVWCYDVDLRLPKWALEIRPGGGNLGALCVADVDGDPNLEVVLGDQQWSVTALDTVTQVREWTLANQDYGTVGIAVGDADGDGARELLWGTDAGTAKANLLVADAATRALEWTSPEYDGPMFGPFVGDFDGGGASEVVVVAASHASTYQGPRVLVFDPYTFALRQEATPLGGTWTATDVQAVDVDGDGDLELAILNSFLELIDWRQGAPVSTRRFYSGSRLLRVADLDGDGALELAIAGTNGVGAQRLTDGSSLWYQTTGFVPERLVVADVDRDGRAELLACGNNSSVRVFDAATGASEATLAGPWSAVDAPLLAPGFALLAVGDRQGRLGLFVPGSGSYGLVGPVPFTTAPVRGVDFLDGTALLVLSSPAGVAIHDGLWPLWRSTPIGTASSRRPVVHWPSLQLFASSEVGLFAFRPR